MFFVFAVMMVLGRFYRRLETVLFEWFREVVDIVADGYFLLLLFIGVSREDWKAFSYLIMLLFIGVSFLDWKAFSTFLKLFLLEVKILQN